MMARGADDHNQWHARIMADPPREARLKAIQAHVRVWEYTTSGSEPYIGIRFKDGTELQCSRDEFPTEDLMARFALYVETHK